MSKKSKFIWLTFFIYGAPILILANTPFFRDSYGSSSWFNPLGIIFCALIAYCIYLFFFKKEISGDERVICIFKGLRKVFNFVFIKNLKGDSEITKEEKVSLLFYMVKIVFTPLMIGFLITNIVSLLNYSENFNFLRLMFYIILFVDTAIFSFGYLVESKKLNNIVKSVEPTFLGWAVALICYPPFNGVGGNLFGWYSSDFSSFGNLHLDFIFGIISILLFTVYVWATIALGFKASNLTNRGIVSTGPYKYIRHPAYIFKNLSWWVMGIPFIINFGIIAILSLSAWSFIYYMRAMTEERHLMADPEYIQYMQKTKYMFIPQVF